MAQDNGPAAARPAASLLRRLDPRCPDICETWLVGVLLLAVAANTTGLISVIRDEDPAQYAVIAKTMAQRLDFVNLYFQGADWLDKPHMPFWIAATSFLTFGVSGWAYKLPALLCSLLAAFYTYSFARLFYARRVAIASALVLVTAENFILGNADVRAEPYLTAFVIGGVYHVLQTIRQRSALHLIAGSAMAAAAVMTKGVFALIPIGGAVAGGLLLAGQWREALNWRWLVALALILLFITPEIYCLWAQFDAHPDAVAFGHTGVSGVRFFFWDSQFGRFFNTGPIRREGADPFNHLASLAWSFLPWSIPLYAAWFDGLRSLARGRIRKPEYFALSGGLITLTMFSASQFQLPHYMTIAFPFLAVTTAAFIFDLSSRTAFRQMRIWQWFAVGALAIATVGVWVALDAVAWPGSIVFATAAVLLLWAVARLPWERWQMRTVALLATAAALANIWLNIAIVPHFMRYQSPSEMAFYINDRFPGVPVAQLREDYMSAFEFYTKAPAPLVSVDDFVAGRLPEGAMVFGTAENIQRYPGPMRVLHRVPSADAIRLRFINPRTRADTLGESWLVQVGEPASPVPSPNNGSSS